MTDTLQDLEQKIAAAEEDIAVMRAKIDAVKARRVSTGEYADPVWFSKIKAALRFKGMDHQKLLRQAAQLRAAERAQSGARTEASFVTVAREKLPVETFREIMGEAIARASVNT